VVTTSYTETDSTTLPATSTVTIISTTLATIVPVETVLCGFTGSFSYNVELPYNAYPVADVNACINACKADNRCHSTLLEPRSGFDCFFYDYTAPELVGTYLTSERGEDYIWDKDCPLEPSDYDFPQR
jgi:hypothetical protein